MLCVPTFRSIFLSAHDLLQKGDTRVQLASTVQKERPNPAPVHLARSATGQGWNNATRARLGSTVLQNRSSITPSTRAQAVITARKVCPFMFAVFYLN